MRDRQTCIGCGKKSPETETNYTLISAQFGWRLTRYRNPDGTIVIEWRCPTCWRDYKKAKGGDSSPGSTTTPVSEKTSDNGRAPSSKPAVASPAHGSAFPPDTPRSPATAPPTKRR